MVQCIDKHCSAFQWTSGKLPPHQFQELDVLRAQLASLGHSKYRSVQGSQQVSDTPPSSSTNHSSSASTPSSSHHPQIRQRYEFNTPSSSRTAVGTPPTSSSSTVAFDSSPLARPQKRRYSGYESDDDGRALRKKIFVNYGRGSKDDPIII